MRKRSGGLHSDTEQQYMMLAELSNETTGIFYDDQKMTKYQKIIGSKSSQPYTPNFKQFNFTLQSEEEKDQMYQLNNINLQRQTQIMLVCGNLAYLKHLIHQAFQIECQPNQLQMEDYTMDLIVRKIQSKKTTEIIKYWLLDQSKLNQLLFETYVKKAQRILRVVEDESVGKKDNIEVCHGQKLACILLAIEKEMSDKQ